jgi:hypothetical protein
MMCCLQCAGPLRPVRFECSRCGLGYVGGMRTPRLSRLSADSADLAERLILAAGNLTAVASVIGVSHPTARKRLDALISDLTDLRKQDQLAADQILGDVEKGLINPEEASRLIGEINGSI